MLRSFVLGTLGLTLSTAAWAQDKPTIAVVGIHQAQLDLPAEAAAVDKLVTAIESSGRFDALDVGEISRRIAGREEIILEEAFFGPGRRLLDDGRLLYESADAEGAIPVLQEAVDVLRVGMATANSSRDLWEAWMYLGVAYLAVDQPEEAKLAWRSAVALSPARNPNPTKFPPDVVTEFDRLRTEQMTEVAPVTIEADRAKVQIYINGDLKGDAPLTIPNVVPGENHLVARGHDGGHAYRILEVDPATPQTVQLTMGAPTLGSSGDNKLGRARQATALYRALGARADIDLVLLVGEFEGRLYLQLYSSGADGFSTPLSVPYQDAATDEAVATVVTVLEMVQVDGSIPVDQTVPNAIPIDVGGNLLLARLLLTPAQAAEAVRPEDDDERKNKGLVRWLVVGAAGAAVATTGVVVATSGGGEPEDPYDGTIIIGPTP